MIKVKLDSINITGAEEQIVKMLVKSIKDDTQGLKCTHCTTDSEVILHVDNSRMSVLRTEVKPCCQHFAEVIEYNLFEAELV